MNSIQIDFEVFKALTNLRKNEEETYNDVIRVLLKLDKKPESLNKPVEDSDAWTSDGIKFLAGTEFRKEYKGKIYIAKVEKGRLMCQGRKFPSLSAAAIAISGSNANGWRFWRSFRAPNSTNWVPVRELESKRSSKKKIDVDSLLAGL